MELTPLGSLSRRSGQLQQSSSGNKSLGGKILDSLLVSAVDSIVSPAFQQVSKGVGDTIKKPFEEKFNAWFNDDSIKSTRNQILNAQKISTSILDDEQKRVANNVSELDWEVGKLKPRYIEAQRKQWMTLDPDQINPATKQPYAALPADAYSDTELFRQVEDQVLAQARKNVELKKKLIQESQDIRTPEQYAQLYKDINPRSENLIEGLFKIGRNKKAAHDKSIEKIKESTWYADALEVKEAEQAYNNGADFDAVKEAVSKVERNRELIKNIDPKYRAKTKIDRQVKVDSDSGRIYNILTKTTVDPLSGETVQSSSIEGGVFGPDGTLAPTDRQLLKAAPDLLALMKSVGLSEEAQRKLRADIHNDTKYHYNNKPITFAAVKQFNDLDLYNKMQDLIVERARDPRNLTGWAKDAGDAGVQTIKILTASIAGQRALRDSQTSAPEKKPGQTQEAYEASRAYQKWFNNRKRANEVIAATTMLAEAMSFGARAAAAGVGTFDPEKMQVVAFAGKEQAFQDLKDMYDGVYDLKQQHKEILRKQARLVELEENLKKQEPPLATTLFSRTR